MIKNISKKIKSLLILSLCCSITFQNTLLIGNAEKTNINVENEISNIPTNSQVEEETIESTDNSEKELDDSTIVENKNESIEEQEEIIENDNTKNNTEDNTLEIIEEDPGLANMGLGVARASSISDVKIVNLSNPNAIGSGNVTSATTLNVRSGPSTSYDKIGTLKENETVEILGTSGSWYKVDFKGKEAYVSAYYLTLNAIDKGIDVSKYNGNIDWQSVKKAGVSYAIIRLGYDGRDGINGIDPKFHVNIKGALDAGIKVGVYWFSYATTVQGAEKEAEKCLETLAPYKGKLAYPVFFDYEYASVNYATSQGITITKDLATNMAKAFLNKIKSNGYLTGLYTNTDFSSRYFHDELIYSNHTWLAQYNTKTTFNKPYSMWQYTDKGTVSGIKGDVDLNYTTLKTFDIGDTPSISDPTKEMGVATTSLNITIGPFTYATVISTVNKGASVEILDKGIPGWYYIQYNGQRGYLPSQFVSTNETGIATTSLNLTIGPFTYATVISTVNKGDYVEILDKSISGWYYVQYNGKRGYLPRQFVSTNETGITTSNLSLTIGPFTYATVVSTVNKGDYVEILDKSIPGWYYVQYNGKRGYLPRQCVPINGSISEIGITISNIDLTIGPFTHATVLSTIKNGSAVEILDKGISGWYYVQYNGQRGYLPTKYVSQSEVGTTTNNIDLTVGPFTYATVITSIPKYSTIEILDRGISGWYYVQYNGQRGYVPINYVK